MVNVDASRPRMAEPHRNVPTAPNRSAGQPGANANVTCYNCRGRGHFASDCPELRRVQALEHPEDVDHTETNGSESIEHKNEAHADLDDNQDFWQPQRFNWADEMDKDDDLEDEVQDVQSLDILHDDGMVLTTVYITLKSKRTSPFSSSQNLPRYLPVKKV